MLDTANTQPQAQMLVPTAAAGVHLWSAQYERIVAALRGAVDAMSADESMPPLTAPPVISRDVVEKAGYLKSFPHLLGSIHSYAGDSRSWPPVADGHWYHDQNQNDLVLTPAVCYHVYPQLAADIFGPATICIHGTCFRQESSSETGRMRSFRMSELVHVGRAQDCVTWRDSWLDRVSRWITAMQVPAEVVPAVDPFFGAGERLMRATQREHKLKWEIHCLVASGVRQAVFSANYHLEHFGRAFGFTCSGEIGHSACVGFGLDRIALALVHHHGPDMTNWPPSVLSQLRPARQ